MDSLGSYLSTDGKPFFKFFGFGILKQRREGGFFMFTGFRWYIKRGKEKIGWEGGWKVRCVLEQGSLFMSTGSR